MAPIIKTRSSIARHSSKSAPNDARRSQLRHASQSSLFPATKDDKRRIKRASLISRIEKANSTLKVRKRRRPSKKLITNLESLADALPEVADGDATIGDARVRSKGLRSRPGAMKRKQKLEQMERERFSQNMAQMAHPSLRTEREAASKDEMGKSLPTSDDPSKRWAALRAHIQTTMK